MTFVYYATGASAILTVVLAVARDPPLLHLRIPPEAGSDCLYGVIWLVPRLLLPGAGIYGGCAGPKLMAASWIGGLACFWCTAAWPLKERR